MFYLIYILYHIYHKYAIQILSFVFVNIIQSYFEMPYDKRYMFEYISLPTSKYLESGVFLNEAIVLLFFVEIRIQQ